MRSCRYCGTADPLSPELASRVASMRARLEARSALQRHLTGKWVGQVTGIQGLTLAIWITTWLLFGGWALGMGLSELPVPLTDFVRMESFAEMEHAAKWWMLFGVAAGLPLSIFLYALSLYWLRSLGLAALPIAPAYPGAPPRCRGCAADLPSGTSLRRCFHCGTDNLVVGERYQKSELDVDRALLTLGERFGGALDARASLAAKTSLFGALFPVGLLIFGLPLGAVLGAAFPALWVLPVALWVLAALAALLVTTRRIPNVEPIDCLVLESEATVGSHPMKVNAQLLVGEPGAARVAAHFFGNEPRSFDLAAFVDTSGKRWRTTSWEIATGGTPLEPEAVPKLEPAELRQPGATLKEGVKVDVARLARQDGGFRIWLSPAPAAGEVPAFTLSKRGQDLMVYA